MQEKYWKTKGSKNLWNYDIAATNAELSEGGPIVVVIDSSSSSSAAQQQNNKH